jgi:hypothetical protein
MKNVAALTAELNIATRSGPQDIIALSPVQGHRCRATTGDVVAISGKDHVAAVV